MTRHPASLLSFAVVLLATGDATANGLTTHVWITRRAIEHLPPGELRTLLERPDLLEDLVSGTIFPDGGYAVGDGYGELAHWEPFQLGLLEHLRAEHSPPYSEEAARHLAFYFGLASHGMADQVFDSLYMERARERDAGSDWSRSMDEATDVVWASLTGAQPVPPRWVPVELLGTLFHRTGNHLVGPETMLRGQNLAGLAVAVVGMLGQDRAAVGDYRAQFPWATGHLEDGEVPGRPELEAKLVARYWQASWARLAGAPPVGSDLVLGTVAPIPGAPATSVESRITIVFARRLLSRDVTAERFRVEVGEGDERRQLAAEPSLFYRDHSHVVHLTLAEVPPPPVAYRVTIDAGLTFAEGVALGAPLELVVEARAPDAAAESTGCSAAGEARGGAAGLWILLFALALAGRSWSIDRMRRLWLATLLAGWTSAGCIISDISLDGKSCPCAEPMVCDTTRDVCVPASELPDAGGPSDSGASHPDATPTREDAAAADAAPAEAGPGDAAEDASAPEDAGEPEDTGAPSDAGTEPDADELDAEAPDAAPPDVGVPDAGTPDLGPRDTGVPDVGFPRDAEPPDLGPPDTGVPDTGPPDTGIRDAGPPDAAPVGSLALGADCMLHAECATRHCLAVVTGTTTFHTCARGCSSTSDCPTDFSCRTVEWSPYCLPERVYVPRERFDTPSGAACAPATETCMSSLCDAVSLTCSERCWRGADCAGFGGVCASFSPDFRTQCRTRGASAVGAACAADADCQTGICNRNTNTCVRTCCSEVDCDVDETCDAYNVGGNAVIKTCRDKRQNPGMLGYGDTCINHGNCESEACASIDGMGGPTRRCTTVCCEDADCAIVPGATRCWPFDHTIAGTTIGYCIP